MPSFRASRGRVETRSAGWAVDRLAVVEVFCLKKLKAPLVVLVDSLKKT